MESIEQGCGERLHRSFWCCNNPVKGPFRNCWKLFCSNYASIAVQYAQKQSISTSEHLVWNTCLMNIQLNTWIQALAKVKSLPFILECFWRHSTPSVNSIHFCAWISNAMIDNANTEGFALKNMILQWHALSWASSLSKLMLFLLSSGKFSWGVNNTVAEIEGSSSFDFPTHLLQYNLFHSHQVWNRKPILTYSDQVSCQWDIPFLFYWFYSQIEAAQSNTPKVLGLYLHFRQESVQ